MRRYINDILNPNKVRGRSTVVKMPGSLLRTEVRTLVRAKKKKVFFEAPAALRVSGGPRLSALTALTAG